MWRPGKSEPEAARVLSPLAGGSDTCTGVRASPVLGAPDPGSGFTNCVASVSEPHAGRGP